MVTIAPDAGSIIWINFTPKSGREQAGTRPALVLSPQAYNEKVGILIACPIISNAKGYAFEVPIPDDSAVTGVVLADHVKSVDWRSREARVVGKVPPATLRQVLAKLNALLKFAG